MARPATATRFPAITRAVLGANHRGSVLTLTLADVGMVEVTMRELLHPKRFARAVRKQTGVALQPPPVDTWRLWLTSCVQQARAKSERCDSSNDGDASDVR